MFRRFVLPSINFNLECLSHYCFCMHLLLSLVILLLTSCAMVSFCAAIHVSESHSKQKKMHTQHTHMDRPENCITNVNSTSFKSCKAFFRTTRFVYIQICLSLSLSLFLSFDLSVLYIPFQLFPLDCRYTQFNIHKAIAVNFQQAHISMHVEQK